MSRRTCSRPTTTRPISPPPSFRTRCRRMTAPCRWSTARCAKCASCRAMAATASPCVRLSEQSVREGDALYKWLAEMLKQRPLRKEELVFSIQEPIVETHIGKAKALAQALRGLGAQVALDYFGVGKNSEKMLEH